MNFNNSKNMSNNIIYDKFNIEPPVECYKLKIVGVYCLVLFILSTFFNSALLWTLIRNKELRTPLNMFIIALTVFNLAGTLIELPFIIISNLYCKWIFKEWGCITSAYLMYFIGCTSIYIMTAISFERFYIIYKPMAIRSMNKNTNLIIIFFCSLNGLIWATLPLFGWSHYSLEGAMTSCSVEWRERSISVTSYNITIFCVVYLIPFICIVLTNLKLLFIVKNLPSKMKNSQEASVKKRVASERYLTVIIIIIILIFVISWTPYALVSMYSAFINPDIVEPLSGTLPAVIAKSSMLWTALVYIFSNKNIRYNVFGNKSKNDSKLSTSRGMNTDNIQDCSCR